MYPQVLTHCFHLIVYQPFWFWANFSVNQEKHPSCRFPQIHSPMSFILFYFLFRSLTSFSFITTVHFRSISNKLSIPLSSSHGKNQSMILLFQQFLFRLSTRSKCYSNSLPTLKDNFLFSLHNKRIKR